MLEFIVSIGLFVWVLSIELRIQCENAPTIEFDSSFLSDFPLKQLDISALSIMHKELVTKRNNLSPDSKQWHQYRLMEIQLETELKSRKEQQHS